MKARTAALIFAIAFFSSALAWAGGRTVYRIALDPPKKILNAEGEARTMFARMTGERLEKRLTAAQIKEYEVDVVDSTTLTVETGVERDPAWMKALLTSPGELSIHVRIHDKPDWMTLARTMPDGLEIRGSKSTYVWSASRGRLEKWIARIALSDATVRVFPEDNGFRTVTLGERVGTRADVRDVRVARSDTGVPFVEMTLQSRVAGRLAAEPRSEVQEVAVVLDGEVIGFVRTKTLKSQNRLRLPVPRGAVADSREARTAWVNQVAGRLAAPLPIPIAVIEE